ncbi:MAG TPA: RNA 2',3'-cyclic phosphodiesterase [Candidatus Angelobacter sp.]|jgi:2'-5' RNA ligase|nr:RNA 2',3'-cyclic phosphodiesterase [Candidatus Angelobacter sp.]
MRIFIGLDIPEEIRCRIGEYMESVRQFAPDARWVRTESLHVTLKFIGETAERGVQAVKETLQQIKVPPFELEFKNVGFFPTPRSARVFWIGIHASEALPQLAATIDEKLEKLGIAKEEKPYSPHLTLARAQMGRGAGRSFQNLQQRLDPDESLQFGTMTAREFFLYKSELLRGGARYTKLQEFRLESS